MLKYVLSTLDKLKSLQLPQEAFTRNIVVDDDNKVVDLGGGSFNDGSGKWHFESIRKKLIELAK